MSPLLFNIILETVLKRAIKDNKNITWGLTDRLEDLDYAIDICLRSHIITDMKLKLTCLNTKASKVRLKINMSKNKHLQIMSNNTDELTRYNEVT